MSSSETIATLANAKGKGILAADESFGSIKKRFDNVGVPTTEETRRAYREMLFTTEGLEAYVSGVILFEETLGHKTAKGQPFVEVLRNKGILPGIKVDQGLVPLAEGSLEQTTKGLDGLPARLEGYVKQGATFAKWRAVFLIGEGLPSSALIDVNAANLAAYAKACQNAGLVPIVEPEVLMEGPHSLERAAEVQDEVLKAVFAALKSRRVDLPQMILKPSMVVPGAKATPVSPRDVGEATVASFRKTLPSELPMVAFLSGGQTEDQVNANLSAINQAAALTEEPWRLTFSFGRSLQKTALGLWKGETAHVAAAQKALLASAARASTASLGR